MSTYRDLELALRDILAPIATAAGARLVEAGVRDVWYTDESPLKGYGRQELPAVQVIVAPENDPVVREQHTAGRVQVTIPFTVLLVLIGSRQSPLRPAALDLREPIEAALDLRRRTQDNGLGANTRVVDALTCGLRIWPEDGNICIAVADVRGKIARLIES